MGTRVVKYDYEKDPADGWFLLKPDGEKVWGKTKAAARSRHLRLCRARQAAETQEEVQNNPLS